MGRRRGLPLTVLIGSNQSAMLTWVRATFWKWATVLPTRSKLWGAKVNIAFKVIQVRHEACRL